MPLKGIAWHNGAFAQSDVCVYKYNIAITVQNVNAMQTALHKYNLHNQEHLVSPNSSQVKFQLFL